MYCECCKQSRRLIALRDNIKTLVLCKSCLSSEFINGRLSFVNNNELIDDISGRNGAVEFISDDERYCLDGKTMLRLISYNLQRHEYSILVRKYGNNMGLLRKELYWNDEPAEDILSMLD
jgi:hypothetical protein